MSIGRLCIATKQKRVIDEEVSVVINGDEFVVHVRELSNWSVKIEDDFNLEDETSKNEQAEPHSDSSEDSIKQEMKNPNIMDETDDISDNEKVNKELRDEELPQNQEQSDSNPTSSDGCCPTGFEFLKGRSTLKPQGSEPHKMSKCSTSFASMARALSGGIISMWDPAVFTKENIWCNDNYVIVQGKWLNISHTYFMVNVYGPQDSTVKTSLWRTLLSFDQHHLGRYVLFGDLNEMNKLVTKMSKLDRFLLSKEVLDDNHDLKAIVLDRVWSDHSPILLHTLKTDYGPIPFKIFHSWFNQKDIDVVINQTFIDSSQNTSRPTVYFHDKLKFIKYRLKAWNSESKKNEVNGKQETGYNEIRKAVWDCGSDKAPGPDGFSFQFLKWYWDLFKTDLEEFVIEFFDTSKLPSGSNSSFLTLILKVSNPMFVKDYRPISLISLQYKIIATILANRLASVVSSLVSKEQSAFILGRQILDDPLMLSEIMDWYKQRNKKMMIFKVDFKKAFDLVNWNHTLEFSIKRRLRQGDPLSPFLFILIMEGLHIAIEDATQSNLIKGVLVGNPGLGYRVLIDLILHRSSINNSASLSNKFGGFYFIFKFGISGLLHHVVTTIADRIRDNGTSQSKQNSQSSSRDSYTRPLLYQVFLILASSPFTVSEVKRAMLHLDFKICAKDKNFSSIWTYSTMMLPRVRNHHGGKCVHPGLS
nr:RNA-directed DNA polymerase, eukaryota, reverse transcriptase zinc-binding domain protein [Tanacetum cinerariifolium]